MVRCLDFTLERCEGKPVWGPRGGVEFVLDPKLQGQGIGKEAYRRTLQGLIQRMSGVCEHNRQSAVLNLAAKLGREMVRFACVPGAR